MNQENVVFFTRFFQPALQVRTATLEMEILSNCYYFQLLFPIISKWKYCPTSNQKVVTSGGSPRNMFLHINYSDVV